MLGPFVPSARQTSILNCKLTDFYSSLLTFQNLYSDVTFPLLEFELETYGDQSVAESFTVKEEVILVLARFWRSRSLCFTYQLLYIYYLMEFWHILNL